MYHTAYFIVPEPPVDEQVTFTVLPLIIDVSLTFEVFVNPADVTLSLRSLLLIVLLPSLTFTRIVYVSTCLGVIFTVVVVE